MCEAKAIVLVMNIYSVHVKCMYIHIFKSWDCEDGEGCFIIKSRKRLGIDELIKVMKNTLVPDYLALFQETVGSDTQNFEEFFEKTCLEDTEKLRVGNFEDYYIQFLGCIEEKDIKTINPTTES